MVNLNKEKLFFFDSNSSSVSIYPNTVEHAYVAILDDNLVSAKRVFMQNDSPRAKWGISLVSILEGFLDVYPTFFGIRNFLEIDLDFLLKNNKISYVEQVLGSLDILVNINQETYKFVARVMLENKLFTAALKYMEKSKDIYYQDPELHFMLAKYFMLQSQNSLSLFYVNECLKLVPEYYPAIILKEKIEQNTL